MGLVLSYLWVVGEGAGQGDALGLAHRELGAVSRGHGGVQVRQAQ